MDGFPGIKQVALERSVTQQYRGFWLLGFVPLPVETNELELIKQRIRETQEKLVGVFTNVLQVLIGETDENSLSDNGNEVIDKINQVLIPDGGAEQLLNECEAMNAYRGNNYLPLLWRFYKSHPLARYFASCSLD